MFWIPNFGWKVANTDQWMDTATNNTNNMDRWQLPDCKTIVLSMETAKTFLFKQQNRDKENENVGPKASTFWERKKKAFTL